MNKKLYKNKYFNIGINLSLVALVSILILILVVIIKPDVGILGSKSQPITPAPLPAIETIEYNPPTPTSQQKQQVQGSQTYDDLDPIVDCYHDALGSLWIKKSECDRGAACDLGNGKWVFTSTKESCREMQDGDSAPTSNTPSSSSMQLIPCTLRTGTYMFLPSTCEKEKKADKEYLENQQEVNTKRQQEANARYQEDLVNQYNQQVSKLKEKCIYDAGSEYRAAEQRAISRYGLSGSIGQGALEIAKKEFDKAMARCDELYPI